VSTPVPGVIVNNVSARRSALTAPALLILLLCLTSIVYWPGLHGGYFFDDYPNIVDNRAIHVGEPTLANWHAASVASPSHVLRRPLAMLSFAVNYYLTGLDPFWFKLTNLCLHLLNGILLFAVLRKLLSLWRRTDSKKASDLSAQAAGILAALITGAWLLAPINLTAVLYVVQRMTSLAQVFVLAGLWFYLHGRSRQFDGRRGWPWLAAGLLGGVVLGMGAKETAIHLTTYALVCEIALLGFSGGNGRRIPALITFFATVTAIPLAIGAFWLLPHLLHGGYNARSFTLGERLLTEGRVLVDYMRWIVLPNPKALSFYHDDLVVSKGWLDPASTLVCIGLLAALLVTAFACLRRAPLVALGLLWFFAAHVLTGTIIPLELVFEHRNYFASIGLLLALFAIVWRLSRNVNLRLPAYVAFCVMIAWPAAVTAMRAQEWSNPLRLASSEALRHPESSRAQYELGRALVIVSDYGRKSPTLLEKAKQAFLVAMRLPNSDIQAEQGLIMIAGHTGRTPDNAWWQSMIDKLKRRPPSAEGRTAVYTLLRCQIKGPCPREPQQMLAVYMSALSHPGADAQLLAGYSQFAAYELDDLPLAQRVAHDAIAQSHNSVIIREALSPILREKTGSSPHNEMTGR
jgi:hypothetical protein